MRLDSWAAHSPSIFRVLKAEELNKPMKSDAGQKIVLLRHPNIYMWFLLPGDHREVKKVEMRARDEEMKRWFG